MAELFVGLMSGTSADGIDVALVEFANNQTRLIDFINQPIDFQPDLVALNQTQEIPLPKLAELEHKTSVNFAQAALKLLEKNQLKPEEITALGSHGQTVFHAPEIGISLQLSKPAIIAKLTGITTVADFRIDDLALGGQGAPLAPAFHQFLLNQLGIEQACVINIGGISNITWFDNNQIIGFDTGPGNGLMDEICQTQLAIPFDKNGLIANLAVPNQQLLTELLKHPYFQQDFPKSTGRETFNQIWLQEIIDQLQLQTDSYELVSTLNQFSVETISLHLDKLNLPAKTACYICGGGAFNPTLLERLQMAQPDLVVSSIAEIGVNPDGLEAMMIAWLAKQRIEQQPIDYRQITGASRPAILGGVWLA